VTAAELQAERPGTVFLRTTEVIGADDCETGHLVRQADAARRGRGGRRAFVDSMAVHGRLHERFEGAMPIGEDAFLLGRL
jgi:hypothetical protein